VAVAAADVVAAAVAGVVAAAAVATKTRRNRTGGRGSRRARPSRAEFANQHAQQELRPPSWRIVVCEQDGAHFFLDVDAERIGCPPKSCPRDSIMSSTQEGKAWAKIKTPLKSGGEKSRSGSGPRKSASALVVDKSGK
jgi:hypothetical protein